MKFGNRPIISSEEFAVFFFSIGFIGGMVLFVVGALLLVVCAAVFAPIAMAVACIAYVIDVVVFWWRHT